MVVSQGPWGGGYSLFSFLFFFFVNIYLVAPGLIYLFIFIFIFGCAGSSFLCEGFL